MNCLENFQIDLKSLKEGLQTLEYDLDDSFFNAIEGSEVSAGRLHVTVDVERVNDSFFALHFHGQGIVMVPCDICLEDMEQPVSIDERLSAKFGEENSEDDDLVTVAEDEGILDVAWFIYEFIRLAIPIRHVHAPGKCDPAMIEKLAQLSAARSGEGHDEQNIDPRWSSLLKLKQ